MPLQNTYTPLKGGMDLITPALSVSPGAVIASLNYEPTSSGYRRLRGYERFDGQTPPSEAICYRFNFDDGGTGLIINQTPASTNLQTPSDGFSGATAAEAVLTSGAWGTSTAVGYILVFVPPEKLANWVDNIEIKDPFFATIGYLVGTPIEQPDTASQLLAAAQARRIIQPIPGNGSVLGVHMYDGQIIAVGNNVGETAAVMHRAVSPTGWLEANVARRLAFTSGGPTELAVGDWIRGGTSFVQAQVQGMFLESGSWAAGDAAGYMLVLHLSSGVYVAESLEKVGVADPDVATIAGDSDPAPTLPINGRYEFINHNFYAVDGREAAYFVNGAGNAFEYDGTTLNIIETGIETDTPQHIAVHKHSLFLSYPGGLVNFSEVGNPFGFTAIQGAGEIGVGDNVTGMIENVGVLTIFGDTTINNLYGNDSSDYQLENFNTEAGGLAWTIQKLGQVYYMDNSGVRSLQSSQAFGNFTLGTITQMVRPLIEDYRRDGVEPVASVVARRKAQYWVFFDNQEALVVYLGGKHPEAMRVNLGKLVTCCMSIEDAGVERIFFGASDGYVYELDKGVSFDGEVIPHYVRFPFNHFGAPQNNKRLHKLTLEMEAIGSTTLEISVDYDYGAQTGSTPVEVTVTSGGGAIDDSGANELYYSSQIEATAEVHIDGLARNFSLKVGGSTSDEEPHVLQGLTWHVAMRGMVR